MAGTDSVSIFTEGTFEEQIQELVNYIVRNQSEEGRSAFIRPFQDALKIEEGGKPIEENEEQRKKVFSMVLTEVKGLGDGSDREIEGFFNLIYSHLLSLYPPETPEAKEHLTTLLQTISSAFSDQQVVKYRILSNIFNAIPRTSPLRLVVYNTLLEIATANDDLEALQLTRADVEKWLSEWDISPNEKSDFLKSLVDAYEESSQPEVAYEYSRLQVRSLPPSSPEACEAAINIVATALRLPTIFDFDPLFKLEAVISVKDHELFSLLQVFLNGSLSEFAAWEKSHQGTLQKYNLDKIQLERKIRLLTLASLSFRYAGHDLPYSKVAEALQVELQDVEKWAIDVIRAGLVWGKLSQTTQSLYITRATARVFEREQWEVLEKRLVAWKSGLTGVLGVVGNAKRQAGLGVV